MNGLDALASSHWQAAAEMDLGDAMIHKDQYGYLPNDILAKVDHASMAVSLESRFWIAGYLNLLGRYPFICKNTKSCWKITFVKSLG